MHLAGLKEEVSLTLRQWWEASKAFGLHRLTWRLLEIRISKWILYHYFFLITTKVWTILRLLLTWQRSAIGSYQLSASCLLKWLILTVKDPEITFYKFPADISVFRGRYPVFISYPSSLSKVNQSLKPVWKEGETYVQILILQTLL